MAVVEDSLIDTSLWVDLIRWRSPQAVKEFVGSYILHPDARLSELVRFEVLRNAPQGERSFLARQMDKVPMLATPNDLWSRATDLGQRCRSQGFSPGAVDLLIAAVALHHAAVIITFDGGFSRIAEVSGLQVEVLVRP